MLDGGAIVVVFVLPGTDAGAWVPSGGMGITPVVPADVAEGVRLFGTLEVTAAAPDAGRPRPVPPVPPATPPTGAPTLPAFFAFGSLWNRNFEFYLVLWHLCNLCKK